MRLFLLLSLALFCGTAVGLNFCSRYPCAPGCERELTCDDYDPLQDRCAEPGQVLAGWQCAGPCHCSGQGKVVCAVSYRCLDMKAEMEAIRRLKKPHLASPVKLP